MTLLSGDEYRQKEVILNNIETIRKNLPLNNIEMRATPHEKYFFNVKGNYGQVLGNSIEFESPELRQKWLQEIKKEIGQSKIIDIC